MNPGLLTIAQPHFYVSEEQPFTAAGIYTFELPLPQMPAAWLGVIVCKTADSPWEVGDIVPMNMVDAAASSLRFSATFRPGKVLLSSLTGWSVRSLANATTLTSLTETRWALQIYAWWPALT